MKGMVSKSRFEEIELMFPPLSEQREFSRQLVAVQRLRAVHDDALLEHDLLVSALQNRAFRGEL